MLRLPKSDSKFLNGYGVVDVTGGSKVWDCVVVDVATVVVVGIVVVNSDIVGVVVLLPVIPLGAVVLIL